MGSKRRRRKHREINKTPCIPLPIIKDTTKYKSITQVKKTVYIPKCPHDFMNKSDGIFSCDECGMRAISYLPQLC
jgi:hypothetical protein